MLRKELEVKTTLIGARAGMRKEMIVLNRRISFTENGIEWEGDSRHAQEIIEAFNLQDGQGLTTPCGDDIRRRINDDDKLLDEKWSKVYRSLAAKGNYLAQDRADIMFTVRMLCKSMANPVESRWWDLRRMARYLLTFPRATCLFPWGGKMSNMKIFTDSDWAGDRQQRNSCSGGVCMINEYFIKAWSKDQKQRALSSAEAELYAANHGVAQGMGICSIAKDFEIELSMELLIDSSAAKAIIERRGLGKTRHIEVADLWLQDQIREGKLVVKKISGNCNPADIGTKPLPGSQIERHLSSMNHRRK